MHFYYHFQKIQKRTLIPVEPRFFPSENVELCIWAGMQVAIKLTAKRLIEKVWTRKGGGEANFFKLDC